MIKVIMQPMKKTFWASLALTGFSIITGIGFAGVGMSSAMAQAFDCAGYRAELSSISRSADPRAQEYLVAAQRQRAELERTREYFNQIGCTRSDMYRTPGECAPLRDSMRQMQANLNEMLSFADKLGGGPRSQARRRQLQAALDQNCANEPAPPQGFFERLFGGNASNEAAPAYPDGGTAPMTDLAEDQSLGGSQPVCVRMADGYFFPLGAQFRGREHAQQVCQAQCPATQTELFFMRQGGTIERAQSAYGVPYSTLPNALVYQKKRIAEAACVPAGQSWEQALQGAEMLIGRHENDIVVTAEKADELSRPKTSSKTASRAEAKRAAVPALAPGDAEDIADPASVPTAGGESAGIGPGIVSDEHTISRKDGPTIISSAADGSQRRVRVVAPYLIPTPTSTTGR